jgi:dTDP-L-rhamnose 4-epimerase
VHVDDVARANLLALDAAVAAAPGTVAAYNVCSGRPVSILDVARIVAREGPAPAVTGEYRLGDVRHIVASPERARADLGFEAEIGPDEGLARFATDPLRA